MYNDDREIDGQGLTTRTMYGTMITEFYKRKEIKPMKLIETRLLSIYKVRELCINGDYYNCGTNEEYDAMFKKCQKENFDILEIAKDILDHSNIERLTERYGLSEIELLECICFSLIKDCCTTIVKIVE